MKVSALTCFVVTLTVAISAAPPTSPEAFIPLAPDLLHRLENGARVNIFLKLKGNVSPLVQQVAEGTTYMSRELRINNLHNLLVSHAQNTQKDIIDFIMKHEATSNHALEEIKSFWINNQILLKGADLFLVENLMLAFSTEIDSIFEDAVVAQIVEPVGFQSKASKKDEDAGLWGLKRIQVAEAWKELGVGNNTVLGGEIRIGTIDTGVRGTHEALRGNLLAWYDSLGSPIPVDDVGHGTHTTGIIAGSKGIGVAPWAKWLSCRACPNLGCLLSALIECGEFMVCPTLEDGSSDCTKAPHVISNSWSGGQGADWYNEVIDVWRAAGIIPVFSIGNFGNAFCGSANYPGDLESVIGVGSTTVDDDLSWFSSIGPTKIGGSLIKPDLVAPGSDILSATNTGDDHYALGSGTSQSCPYVSGIIALLLTQNPGITFDQAKNAILSTTEHGLRTRGLVCEGIPDTRYPNHVYGHGIANALKSLQRSRAYFS